MSTIRNEKEKLPLEWLHVQPGCASILTVGKTAHIIMESMKKSGNITISDISETLNLPQTTVYKTVNALKRAGKIRRKGGDRCGAWEVLEKIESGGASGLPEIIHKTRPAKQKPALQE